MDVNIQEKNTCNKLDSGVGTATMKMKKKQTIKTKRKKHFDDLHRELENLWNMKVVMSEQSPQILRSIVNQRKNREHTDHIIITIS